MGTWGTGIFSNDLASDIRSEFRNKIGFGKSPSDVTNELVLEHQDYLDDSEVYCVFWIALAATQWDLGRLQENVKNKALEIIDSKRDLSRWQENLKDQKKRGIVLQKLKEKLLSPQPEAKKIPIPFIIQTKMEVGDLLMYKHKSDKYILLRVIEIQQDNRGDRYPRIEVLDYFSKKQPDKNEIYRLSRKRKELNLSEASERGMFKPSNLYYVAPYGKRDNEPWNNLIYIDKKTKSSDGNKGSTPLIWWKDVDDFIEDLFKK